MVHPASAHRTESSSSSISLELPMNSWPKPSDEPEHVNDSSSALTTSSASTLTFEALSTTGGEYSPEHVCHQLLKDDKSCYSTQLGSDRGVNIIAKHANSTICNIEGVSLRIPEHGFSCPVAQVIIFTSWEEPDLEGLAVFDDVHSQQNFDAVSQAWCQKVDFSRPSPVALLDMRHTHQAFVSLPVARSGKYVVIKLLRPRDPAEESYRPATENLDVEFVGLHGWSGRRCLPCRLPVP